MGYESSPMDIDHRHTVLGMPLDFAFAILALFVTINLLYLDIVVVNRLNTPQEASSITVQSVSNKPTDGQCPQACLTKIQEITPASPTASITSTPQPSQAPKNPSIPSVKEFFIPFGSGSGIATDWADMPGLIATIDTKNYPRIKTVTFEASLRTPTGNQTAYVRLYNTTDQHPVWFSDVSLDGGTPQLVTSSPITLDSGSKTYQVQLKTSLGYTSYIDQARLRIETY